MLLTPTPPVNGNNDYGSYDNYAGGGGQTEEPYEPDYGVFVDDEPTEPPDKQEDQEHNYTEEPVEEMAFDKPNDDVYNGDVIDIPHVTTEPPMDTPTYSNDPPEPVATTAPSGAVLATSIKSCNGNSWYNWTIDGDTKIYTGSAWHTVTAYKTLVYANDGKWYYIAGATTAPTAAPTTPPTDISSVLFVGISGGMITGTDI